MESVDIIGGKGMFTTLATFEEDWQHASNLTSTSYTFDVIQANTNLNTTDTSATVGSEEGQMLVIEKKAISKFDYDDGVYLTFNNSQPRHI